MLNEIGNSLLWLMIAGRCAPAINSWSTPTNCRLEPFLSVGSKRSVPEFTAENIGLAAQHGYISPAAELSGVFTPPFETVPLDN